MPMRRNRTSTIPSGRALRIAESPFTKKMIDRQRAFGGVIEDAVSYGLRLAGIDLQPGALRVNWESAAPLSDEDVWDLVLTKRSAGMPLVSALRESGYEPDQIETIRRELIQEGVEAARAFSVEAARAFSVEAARAFSMDMVLWCHHLAQWIKSSDAEVNAEGRAKVEDA